MPAICGPLPCVAEHAVESKGIDLERIDIGEHPIVPWTAAAVAVRVVDADLVAPPARCCRSAAGCIFPLRFARQAVARLSHLLVQPRDIALGVAPIEADR